MFTSLKNGNYYEILFIQIPIVLFVVYFCSTTNLNGAIGLKINNRPLVLKSPSNQSNILDISIYLL
jgi:hypothetical protein